MIINNYTKVEVVEEASIISTQKKYNFTPLKSTSIDPNSTTTTGRRSFSTRSSSNILINPTIPEAEEMLSFSIQKKEVLDDIVSKKSYLQPPKPKDLETTSIQKIMDSGELGSIHWIKGSITSIPENQQFWYMACSHCKKKTQETYGSSFTCLNCNKLDIAVPRCVINVEITDSTTSIHATLFEDEAQKIFSCTGEHIMNTPMKENYDQLKIWMKNCQDKIFLFCIKVQEHQSGQRRAIIITSQKNE
ncbi:replication protein A DNA-binding subunit B-like protein [Cinnamomum micranthum f. kanehirae]|uniref:Replication protein A DNA-binding subunit B-like protein n=1 Tax=Cinnamomum micranthum f. kanehirae TaxID=337451 RepID=A0A3S4NJR2_9MAGN|nr:replication protein A DNA-binding subunit B-like protein [Cinnamomum micranthum f. kanehirae]